MVVPYLLPDLIQTQAIHQPIDNQRLMSGPLQQSFRVPKLEWQMRFAAAEVNTAFETPVRIEQ